MQGAHDACEVRRIRRRKTRDFERADRIPVYGYGIRERFYPFRGSIVQNGRSGRLRRPITIGVETRILLRPIEPKGKTPVVADDRKIRRRKSILHLRAGCRRIRYPMRVVLGRKLQTKVRNTIGILLRDKFNRTINRYKVSGALALILRRRNRAEFELDRPIVGQRRRSADIPYGARTADVGDINEDFRVCAERSRGEERGNCDDVFHK